MSFGVPSDRKPSLTRGDFLFATAIAIFYTVSLPLHVEVDGLLYQMSARSLFTSDFEQYYNLQREPGYPLFLRYALLIGFQTDLLYVFAQTLLLLTCIILLARYNWATITLNGRTYPKTLNGTIFIVLFLNPQATIWLNFLTKQALISIFLLLCQISITRHLLSQDGGSSSPQNRLWPVKHFFLASAFGIAGYSISLAAGVAYVFALAITVLVSLSLPYTTKKRQRPPQIPVNQISLILRLAGGACGLLGSKLIWQSYADSHRPGYSFFQHIDGTATSALSKIKANPLDYLYEAANSFRALIGFGKFANRQDEFVQENMVFAERQLEPGRACGSIIKYEGSWFEGALNPDFAYWIEPTCKPEAFVATHRFMLPLSDFVHTGVILFSLTCALVLTFFKRNLQGLTSVVVSLGFIGTYAASQVLSLDRYGVPLFFLSTALCVPLCHLFITSFFSKFSNSSKP